MSDVSSDPTATSEGCDAKKDFICDLPDDLLLLVFGHVNVASHLYVGPHLLNAVLASKRILAAAKSRLEQHQRHIKKFGTIIIDARRPGTAPNSLFPSLVMMLIALYKDRLHSDDKIRHYVHKLEYITPGKDEEAPRGSGTLLEALDYQQTRMDEWNRHLKAKAAELYPQSTDADRALWVHHLWQRDNGEGLSLVLPQLPLLTALRLSGHESRWVGVSGLYVSTGATSPNRRYGVIVSRDIGVRRLVLHNISCLGHAFKPFRIPTFSCSSVRQLEIYCHPTNFTSSHFQGNSDWLQIPEVKIVGYRGWLCSIASALQTASFTRIQRLEVISEYRIEGGLPAFIRCFGAMFECRNFCKPTFCYESGKSIKMVVKRDQTSHWSRQWLR
jgi:hypothetical protein